MAQIIGKLYSLEELKPFFPQREFLKLTGEDWILPVDLKINKHILPKA